MVQQWLFISFPPSSMKNENKQQGSNTSSDTNRDDSSMNRGNQDQTNRQDSGGNFAANPDRATDGSSR
jgi:hypothetical protein